MTAPVARDPDFVPGLEGVVAFESEIAEPDKDGGALRYRGVDIDDLVGHKDYAQVWGLLVDGSFAPGLPPAEPFPVPVHSGDIRVDVQSALAMLAPATGVMRPAAGHLRRARAREDARPRLRHDLVVRGPGRPRAGLCRWCRRSGWTRLQRRSPSGSWSAGAASPDPKHVKPRWTPTGSSGAEHGMNASTFTARVIASTGADVAAACLSSCGGRDVRPAARRRAGPGARSMIEEVERHRRRRRLREGGAGPRRSADGLRPPGLPGRGSRGPGCCGARPRSWARAAVRGGRGAGARRRSGRAARPSATRTGRAGARTWSSGRPIVLDFAEVPPSHVHLDVHLCPHGGLVGAHHGAEAHWASLVRPSGPLRRAQARARCGRWKASPEVLDQDN